MKNEQFKYNYDGCSWLDCIGDIYEKKQKIFQNSDKNTGQAFENQMDLEIQNNKININENQNKSNKREREKSDTKLQQHSNDTDNLFWATQNYSSSNEVEHNKYSCFKQNKSKKQKQPKQSKGTKQHIYSKNYRQKKKQQMKILQEQNQMLRKKITELQFRLRQKQIEINRIKHQPPQISLKVQELNQQFLKSFQLTVKNDQQFFKKQKQKVPICSYEKQRQQKIQKFYKNYAKYGFAGTDKIQSINYYFNQVLQCIFRDSQKYVCMLCYKNKNNKDIDQNFQHIRGYQMIDNVFYQSTDLNQEKLHQFKQYFKGIQPLIIDLKNYITIFYHCFKNVVKSMQKIHQYMQNLYPKDMSLTLKRMRIQKWFQQNKYTKILRKLRTDWLNLIKNDNEQDNQDVKKISQANKKKKLEKLL